MSDHESYEVTEAPRRRRRDDGLPTHWRFIEIEGDSPEMKEMERAREHLEPNCCRLCGKEGIGMILHQDPASSDIRRTICGGCQGITNGKRLGLY